MAAKGSGEPPPRKTLYLVLRILLYKLAVAASAATANILSLSQVEKNNFQSDKGVADLQVSKLCLRMYIIFQKGSNIGNYLICFVLLM